MIQYVYFNDSVSHKLIIKIEIFLGKRNTEHKYFVFFFKSQNNWGNILSVFKSKFKESDGICGQNILMFLRQIRHFK